ncbi:TonB family protein [Bradyrhizobium sp. UFLA05-109]
MPDLDIEPRPSRRLWVLAAVAALALHLGGAALALAHLRTDGGDDGLGAAGADFAVEMASPDAPESELPPGPDTDASQEQRAMPEQKAEVKETELPKDQHQDVDDADRVVTDNNAKKPDDESQKVAAIETPATEASPQSVATARQKLDEAAREAEKAMAPVLGIGKDILKLTADWNRKISAHFKLHQVYPEGREPKSQKVKVTLVLNRKGNVLSVDVVESSGDAAFDAAAVSMIRRSDPVPQPPAGLTDEKFERTLDVTFPPRETKKRSAQRQ